MRKNQVDNYIGKARLRRPPIPSDDVNKYLLVIVMQIVFGGNKPKPELFLRPQLPLSSLVKRGKSILQPDKALTRECCTF